MTVQTYLSTDWLELGDSTMVKVVLTDESAAYLISVTNVNGKPEAELFKLDARKLRREDFFKAVMDAWREAEKVPVERAFMFRIVTQPEIEDVMQQITG